MPFFPVTGTQHLCSSCFNCNHGSVLGDLILVLAHNAFLQVTDFYKRSAKGNPPRAALNLYSTLRIEDREGLILVFTLAKSRCIEKNTHPLHTEE